MNTDRELMQQALEALENVRHYDKENLYGLDDDIADLRERLAQPEQTVSMTEYKRLQDLVTSQGIRLMEYESAQTEQEPFCYHDGRNIVGKEFADHSDVFHLYTAPQPRQWQGLTDEEKAELDAEYGDDTLAHLDAIEAKLREKNA